LIEKLYDYYKLDFQMFGYPAPIKYIEMGYTEVHEEEKMENNENNVEVNDQNLGT
jgi:hypothetical protein